MREYTIRLWQPEDVPVLIALWQTAFGDDRAYIEKYHSMFLKPGSCLVAEADGKPVSAMYFMAGPMLFPPSGRSYSTIYTYALATDPAYRRRGIGTAVYRACAKLALTRADTACVLPSRADQYPFYQKANGCVPVSFVREAEFTPDDLRGVRAAEATPISAGEYYLRRKSILRGRPYAIMSGSYLALESYHMERFGGGFFSLDGDVAAVEMDHGVCRVPELLDADNDGMDAIAAIAARFPAERYVVRSPVFFSSPGVIRPFMLGAVEPELDAQIPDDLWWGFAFD